MQKILELIHEWKLTICVTSKHKEDLVHIRDMHRLLSYKGYRFPDVDRRAAQVLNESDRLKSAEELEEEDRAAQSAKLQELIRRGTPRDLAAAQELMKIMAGAEPDKQPDYQAQMQKELDRVQSRVLLLNELLNNAQPGEKFVEGDAFDQLSQKCKLVQPKLQKWISESSENPDMMDRLLLINDLTNNVLERYIAFKAGDFSATAEINPAFAGKDTAAAKDRAKEVSLIDFDDQEEVTTLPSNPTGSNIQQLDGLLNSISISSAEPSTETKTLGGGLPGNLFFDPTPLQEISRSTKQPGPSTGHNFFSPQNAQAPSSWGTGLGSSMNQNISPDVTGAISLGGTSSSSKFPQPGSTSAVRATPNHSLPSLTPSNPSSVQSRPMSTAPSNMSSTNPNNTTTATSKPPVNDPFADLVGLF